MAATTYSIKRTVTVTVIELRLSVSDHDRLSVMISDRDSDMYSTRDRVEVA